MTKEELQQAIRKNQETMQNQFIDKIYDDISYLCEKANLKSYEPTAHEKITLGKIQAIINNMCKWF